MATSSAPIWNGTFGVQEFKGLLERIDANLQPFPPTAQVAAQQGRVNRFFSQTILVPRFASRMVLAPGKYLSSLFDQAILDGEIDSFTEVASSNGPFTYFHKGSLVYLGGGPRKSTQLEAPGE